MALTREEVASFLLEGGYVLTALEFHQELLEEGTEIGILQKKFETAPDASKTREQQARPEGGSRGIPLRKHATDRSKQTSF
jgi:hypothetical protein